MNIDATHSQWKQTVTTLMQKRHSFTLINWDPAFVPDEELKQLAVHYNYNRTVESSLDKIKFEPRISN